VKPAFITPATIYVKAGVKTRAESGKHQGLKIVSYFVIPVKTGIRKLPDNTGYHRIEHGAGLSGPVWHRA